MESRDESSIHGVYRCVRRPTLTSEEHDYPHKAHLVDAPGALGHLER
jgi:hypothetical protein